MKKLVPFLFFEKEEDFNQCFKDGYIGNAILYKGIPVTFAEDDFLHICFEAGPGGSYKTKFGIRRARRILIIKELLEEKLPGDLLHEPSTGNYCILCEPLDFCLFLVPNPRNKTLQMGTIIHYGGGFSSAIAKQRSKSVEVDKIVF